MALTLVHAWLFTVADRFGVLAVLALISSWVVDQTRWAIHDFEIGLT